MKDYDWIILRLIVEIDNSSSNFDHDSLKAVQYLIKKYGRKKLQKYVDILENERIAKIELSRLEQKIDELRRQADQIRFDVGLPFPKPTEYVINNVGVPLSSGTGITLTTSNGAGAPTWQVS